MVTAIIVGAILILVLAGAAWSTRDEDAETRHDAMGEPILPPDDESDSPLSRFR